MKRLLFTLVSLAILVGLFSLYNLNQVILRSPLHLTQKIYLPVWASFFLLGGICLAIPILFGAIQDLRNLPKAWTSRRQKKVHKNIQQWYSHAAEAAQAGNLEDALEQFRAILDKEPQHFETLMAAGDLYRRARRIPEAVDLHKRAHRLREEDPRPLSSLVSDYEATGDLKQATAVLGQIISRNPRHSLEAYRRLRNVCVKDASWEKAWEVQQRIHSLEKDTAALMMEKEEYSYGIQYQLAMEWQQKGKTREAENLLRRIFKEAPGFGPVGLALGRLMAETGKNTEALKIWSQGFERTGIPAFLQAIVEHYLDADEPHQAIDAVQKSIRSSEHPLLSRLALGLLYGRLEMVDQALEEFTSLEAEMPDSPVLVHHMARLLERRGQHQEAAARYSQLLSQMKAQPPDYLCTGCRDPFPDWQDRCDNCGLWGSLAFQLQEGGTADHLRVSSAPVYSAG
ncbi:MAG: tetratricopeptide repeat protein [Acidobacteriota bacterium]